jgi:hypothetical protein
MTQKTHLADEWDTLPDTKPATEEAIRKAQEIRVEEEFDRLLNDWYADEPPTQKIKPLRGGDIETRTNDQRTVPLAHPISGTRVRHPEAARKTR